VDQHFTVVEGHIPTAKTKGGRRPPQLGAAVATSVHKCMGGGSAADEASNERREGRRVLQGPDTVHEPESPTRGRLHASRDNPAVATSVGRMLMQDAPAYPPAGDPVELKRLVVR